MSNIEVNNIDVLCLGNFISHNFHMAKLYQQDIVADLSKPSTKSEAKEFTALYGLSS